MFNSKIKRKDTMKSYKFDLNLVINDKHAPSSFNQSTPTKNNAYSELCEKSILNNESKPIRKYLMK
jgi:hypothetical protein